MSDSNLLDLKGLNSNLKFKDKVLKEDKEVNGLILVALTKAKNNHSLK
jgi:hypothetical protein